MKMLPYLYTWFLPLAWAVCSLVSYYYYPGANYEMWVITSLPGLWWVVFGGGSDLTQQWVPLVTALCGALVMVPFGYTIDRLKLHYKVFAVVWWMPFLAAATQLIYKHDSVPGAIAANGSFGCYVFAGANISLLATSVFVIAWLGWKRSAENAKQRGQAKKGNPSA